jgi:hypothetical protein
MELQIVHKSTLSVKRLALQFASLHVNGSARHRSTSPYHPNIRYSSHQRLRFIEASRVLFVLCILPLPRVIRPSLPKLEGAIE